MRRTVPGSGAGETMSDSSQDWLPKVDLNSEAVVEEDYSLDPELIQI